MRDLWVGRRRVVVSVLTVAAVAVGVAVVAIMTDRAATVSVAPFVDPTEQVPTAGAPAVGAQTAPTEALAAAQAKARDIKPLPAREAIKELRAAADSKTTMDIDADGHVRLVAAPAGKTLRSAPGAPETTDPQTAAAAFVNRYGQGFGLRAGQQARASRLDALPGGDSVVRFAQHVGGVPVIGGDIIVTVNGAGQVLLATAEAPAGAAVSTSAAVSAEAAGKAALGAAATRLEAEAAQLTVTSAKLWLYDPRILGAPGKAELRPTWWVTVGWSGVATRAASVLVDALDGSVALAYSELREVNRLICDNNNAVLNINLNPNAYVCSDAAGGPPVVRREGGAASAVPDVNAAYDMLGATWTYYKNRFGRDSIDGRGLQLRATVRYCEQGYPCPFANAFWDGSQMVFGQGMASDDVTAHELTHGVTDYTSGLIYWSESGAINESLSDIFGQFVDLSRGGDITADDATWLMGEDSALGTIRSMSNPNAYGQPSAAGPSYLYWSDGYSDWLDNYGVHTLSGVPNYAAYLIAKGGTALGHTVSPIGIPKSEQIWYRAQFMLPSGAQLPELAAILPAACRSIIGVAGYGSAAKITAADCRQVDEAMLATNMDWSASDTVSSPRCPGGQPQNIIFMDDFERSMNRWRLDAPAWVRLPSYEYPVSWSHSGRGALDAFIEAGSTYGVRAEMVTPITIPADAWVWMAVNTPEQGGGTLLYNDGTGWKVVPSANTTPSMSATLGYDTVRYDLWDLAGKEVRLALAANRPNTGYAEWLVDDFMIYQCLDQAGEPRSVAADLSADGTSMDISWRAPSYVGPGISGYDVTITPAPSGFTSPFTISDPATLSLHVTGLTPGTRYVISVRTLGTGGTISRAITIHTPSDPLVNCATIDDPATRPRSGTACATLPLPG